MKILRISLRNLASLEGTQTVDFTTGELQRTGLYAICGDTGSGKTTLLDALCLALYDNTPRLKTANRSVSLADADKTISESDPRNLLRQGKAEGFAEVAFVGVDGAVYTAHWRVHRSRNNPEKPLQPSEMVLWRGNVRDGEEGVQEIGGRKTEVKRIIEEKVGLTYEQFTRAVLLAQNEFAAFLKAPENERAAILQALTNTQRFEEISKAVFLRHKEEKRLLAEIEDRLQLTAPLGEEARALAETELNEAAEAERGIETRRNLRLEHVKWFATHRSLSGEKERAALKKTAAEQARTEAEPRRLELGHTEAARDGRPLWDAEIRAVSMLEEAESSLEAALKREQTVREHCEKQRGIQGTCRQSLQSAREAFLAARPELAKARTLDTDLFHLGSALANAKAAHAEAERQSRDLQARRAELDASGKTAREMHAKLSSEHARLAYLQTLAPEASAWSDRLARCQEAREWFNNRRGHQQDRATVLESKESALREFGAQLQAAKDAEASAREELGKAQQEVGKFDAEEIAQRRKHADVTYNALRELRSIALLQIDLHKLDTGQQSGLAELRELQDTRLPGAKKDAEAAASALELAEATIADVALSLREKLLEGVPCPVCGSAEHPFSHEAPGMDELLLRRHRERRDQALQLLRDLQAKAEGLDQLCQERAREITVKAADLVNLENALDEETREVSQNAEIKPLLELEPSARLEALVRQLKHVETIRDVTEASAALMRKAQFAFDECRAAHDKTRDDLANLETRASNLKTEWEVAKRDLVTAQEALNTASEELRDDENTIAPLLAAIPGSDEVWRADPSALREAFAKNAARYLELARLIRDQAEILRLNEVEAAACESRVKEAQELTTNRRAAEESAQNAFDQSRGLRDALLGGRPADEVEEELSKAVETREIALKEAETALGEAEKEQSAATEHRAGREETKRKARDAQISARTQLDAWLQNFAERRGLTLDREVLARLLARDSAWITAERTALHELDNAVSGATGELRAHEEALTSHLALRPTPDEEDAVAQDLRQLEDGLKTAKTRADTARVVINQDDQRKLQTSELVQEKVAQENSEGTWSKLNALIGASDGAKFRGIAQRRTLDILLRYANLQLEQLSGRYRLERLPESLNLVVADQYLGDERRSVYSLSGGESFIVSLALALALAFLTSNRLQIESLFIDEGFSCLDQETLQTALTALSHLEAQGRKVGVISHVKEFTDAIPVQIHVRKGHAGASFIQTPQVAPFAV